MSSLEQNRLREMFRGGTKAGMKLSDYMAREGVSAEEMARRLRVHRVAVTRYCNGTRRPNWDVLARLPEATGGEVSAADFVPSDEAAA